MILNFLIRQYHLLLLLLAIFYGALAYSPLMYPLSHADFILYCSFSLVLPYSNSWWSYLSGEWFFYCLHGLLVSWPFPPVSSTLLHTSDLLYNNIVLIIIVTVNTLCNSNFKYPTLIIICHLSSSRLLVATNPFDSLGPTTHWPYYLYIISHHTPPHVLTLFFIHFKFFGQP